ELNSVFQHYFDVPESIFLLPPEFAAMMDPNNPPPSEPIQIKVPQGTENLISTSVTLTQPLWLSGKIGLGLNAAKRYRELSALQQNVTREELRVMLTNLFYGAILADSAVQVTREGYNQAQEYREQVKHMFDEGMVSEYDLIRADVAVANQKPAVTQSEAQRDNVYRALKNLLGYSVDQPIEIRGSLEAPNPIAAGYSESSDMAKEYRPEFTQLELQRALYDIQYKVERRNVYWPNFFARLEYTNLAQSNDLEIEKYRFLDGFGGSLVLQIPLFDGFKSKHRAEQAVVDKRNVDLQAAQLERGVQMQVHQAMSDYRKAEEDLDAARESLRQAEKGYDIAQVRYKEGVGTQLEVLDAQLQLNVSKMQVLQARYNLLTARAEYDRAVGSHFENQDE
ncbi:hypothetical protein GF324_05280, partial [bacterium]|nr:hypothetical protein [bacterium]